MKQITLKSTIGKFLNLSKVLLIVTILLGSANCFAIPTAPGNAINFDGTDDGVDCSNNAWFQFATTGTIEAWIKTNSTNFQLIVAKPEAYGLFVNTGGYLMGKNYGNSSEEITSTAFVADGHWHHVALSFNLGVTDGTTMYVDGKAVKTFTSSVKLQIVPLLIGKFNTSAKFIGQMDQIAIWNTKRTEAQIRSTMYTEVANPTTETGLVAYYKCDETTGTTLTDHTANGLNGTVAGGATWSESYAMISPTLNEATNITETSITVNWTAPVTGTYDGCIVTVATDEGFSNIVLAEHYTSNTATSYTKTDLSPNTQYYYKVRVYKSGFNTGAWHYTSPKSVKTLATPPGNALALNGTNQYVNLGNTINPTTFTIEAWVKYDALTALNCVVSKVHNQAPNVGKNLEFAVNSSGQVSLMIPDGSWTPVATSVQTITTGKWYHIAASYDGTTAKFFVNGKEDVNTLTNNNYVTSDVDMYIGARPNNQGTTPSLLSDASIDEVRIWNTALTETQIRAKMFTELAGTETGLLAYYDFNQNDGETVLNDKTTNYNGTFGNLIGSEWEESYAMVQPVPNAATSITGDGFTANWTTPVTGIVNTYHLEVDDNINFTSPTTQDITAPTTSKAITGLNETTTYYYRVRAEKTSTGDVAYYHYSSPISVTTDVASMTAPGNALAFNGTNQYVNLGNTINPTTFTIESWIKFNTLGSLKSIVSKVHNQAPDTHKNLELAVNASGQVSFMIPNGTAWNSVASAQSITVGKWYHIAASYDGTTAKVFVNGIEDANTLTNNNYVTSDVDMYIGSRPNNLGTSPSLLSDASIDEVRIWNTALTEAQIRTKMFSQLVGTETGLLAYYDFNHNDGTSTLKDKTANGYDGTLTNMTGNEWEESYAMVQPVPTAATSITGDGFTANWTAPITGIVNTYHLEVADNANFTSATTHDITAPTTSKAVTGLNETTTYYYRVRAEKTSTGDVAYYHYSSPINLTTTSTNPTSTWNGTSWSPSAPNPTDDVVINGNFPSSTNFTCNNLTINTGANFTANPNTCATINGTIDNQNGADGMMLGNGASLINTTPGVAGKYNKNFNANDWSFAATPVGNFPVQNLFNGDYVYTYSENAATQADAWINLTLGNTFSSITGYLVKTTASNKVYGGVYGQGDISTPTLSYTNPHPTIGHGGFNLIGNPYPSYLNWDGSVANWTLTGLDANKTIYVWNGSAYTAYISTEAHQIIPGQSFFVKAAQAGASITVKNGARACKITPPKSQLKGFKLLANTTDYKDEIKFYNLSHTAISSKLLTWTKEVPQIYIVNNEEKQAIQVFENIDENTSYNIGVKCGISTTINFSIKDFNFNSDLFVYIEDTKTNKIKNLTNNEVYSFQHTEGEENNRFILHVRRKTFSTEDLENSDIQIYTNQKTLFINSNELILQKVEIYDISGKLISSKKLNSSKESINITNYNKGLFIVKITTNKGVFAEKIILL